MRIAGTGGGGGGGGMCIFLTLTFYTFHFFPIVEITARPMVKIGTHTPAIEGLKACLILKKKLLIPKHKHGLKYIKHKTHSVLSKIHKGE